MMFSVIVPYFKNAKIVRRCLNSIVSQTEQLFEVLLIDDGSQDDIDEIVSSYQDCRIKVMHKSNGGAASARNFGVRNANYEYICFLDSDDEWLPNHLSVLKQMIADFPEADWYITSHRRMGNTIYESNRCLSDFNEDVFKVKNLLKLHFERGTIEHTNSICMRKDFFVKMQGFNEKARIGEDNDLWFRCAMYSDPILTKESTTIYYRDYSYLTKNRPVENDWPFLSQYNASGITEEKKHYVNLICEQYILSLCKHLLVEGNRKECKKKLSQLNRPISRELRKNYYVVVASSWLPCFIVSALGKTLIEKRKKMY